MFKAVSTSYLSMNDVSFVVATFEDGSVTWRRRTMCQEGVRGVNKGGGVCP